MRLLIAFFCLLMHPMGFAEEYVPIKEICGISLTKTSLLYLPPTQVENRTNKYGREDVVSYNIITKEKPKYFGWLQIHRFDYKISDVITLENIMNQALPAKRWHSINKFTEVSERLSNIFWQPPTLLFQIGTASTGQDFFYNIQATIYLTNSCLAQFDIVSTMNRTQANNLFTTIQKELRANSQIPLLNFHQRQKPILSAILLLTSLIIMLFLLLLFFYFLYKKIVKPFFTKKLSKQKVRFMLLRLFLLFA